MTSECDSKLTVLNDKERITVTKSPAQFFKENKAIAGFQNPAKSLFTAIRELVENGLDGAESIKNPPDIEVILEEISHEELFRIFNNL